MNKKILIVATIVVASIVMVGCHSAKLPDGFDKVKVDSCAEDFIEHINDRDYEECYNQFADIMKTSMDEDNLASTFDPILDNLGKFNSIEKITYTSANSLGVDYGVCTVKCSYENGNATYTISLDKDMKIGGLYIK